MCAHPQLLNSVWLFATSQTVAHLAPLSMGILQARILEWVAMPSSRGSSRPRDRTHVSCVAGRSFTTEPPERPSHADGHQLFLPGDCCKESCYGYSNHICPFRGQKCWPASVLSEDPGVKWLDHRAWVHFVWHKHFSEVITLSCVPTRDVPTRGPTPWPALGITDGSAFPVSEQRLPAVVSICVSDGERSCVHR